MFLRIRVPFTLCGCFAHFAFFAVQCLARVAECGATLSLALA
jgi:hypothetical protein